MLVTLDGIITDPSALHLTNADSPMLVTPSAMTTSVILEYASGNTVDNVLTHSGIVTEVNSVHPRNALLSMLVTLAGIITDLSPL